MTAVDFVPFVERLAKISGEAIMPFFRAAFAMEDKSGGGVFDPVTEADRAAEAAMRRLIGEAFPHHGVIGEEFGAERQDSEYVWVLDPIDGTKSFITGFPLFGTLIALCQGERPVLGVLETPALAERWVGCEGRATLFNGVKARARDCRTMDEAVVYTTTAETFSVAEWQRFEALTRRAALRRYGGDCYLYGMLSSGHCDLVIEVQLKPHDYMAVVPVVEGAGGRISDWRGAPLGMTTDGRVVAAATEALWRQAVEELKRL